MFLVTRTCNFCLCRAFPKIPQNPCQEIDSSNPNRHILTSGKASLPHAVFYVCSSCIYQLLELFIEITAIMQTVFTPKYPFCSLIYPLPIFKLHHYIQQIILHVTNAQALEGETEKNKKLSLIGQAPCCYSNRHFKNCFKIQFMQNCRLLLCQSY